MNNLIKLFNMFRNRPNHLYKFLKENDAFKEDFIKRVSSNGKLKRASNITTQNFSNIDQMQDYLNSLIDLSDDDDQTLEQRLNQKLKEAIEKEDYESASKIRDQMKKLNFKKF